MKTAPWTTEQIPSQTGRRVIITGANSGIGWHTALELARHGAEVVVGARSPEKANDAVDRIRQEVPNGRLVPGVLDLASLKSVRAFAMEFGRAPLDLLINNAGVMAVPQRELTEDGFERQFATNYLGPFALTALLFPSIRQQAGSRIVTVSSSAGMWAKLDFENLQSERVYKPMLQAYAQSKLADSIFALELHRRLIATGSPIVSIAAHPGYAITNLQTSGPGQTHHLVLRVLMAVLKPIASQDAAHGALPTLYAAVATDAVPGGYYGPHFMQMKGYPAPAPIPRSAQDAEVGKRLWAVSEQLTNASFDALPPATP